MRFGTELTFLEILSVRIGYFSEKHYRLLSNDNTIYSYSTIPQKVNKITYGFGIQLPLNKIYGNKFPINISIDYALLPQEFYINSWDDKDYYNNINVSINWVI
ncbi:MAG: hypothetical protein IIA88_03325 [Bacteroidetes bacterium]|nr:hypothetical protein [Bacteroidota bacterium]